MPQLPLAVLQPPFVGLLTESTSATQDGSSGKESRVLRELSGKERPNRILESPIQEKEMYDEESPSEYIDPEYSSYEQKVKAVIVAAKGPVTYGAIHAQLKEDARRDLTQSVCSGLTAMSLNDEGYVDVVHIPGYLERFCIREHLPKDESGKVKESQWFGELTHYRAKCFKGSKWVNRT